MGQYRQVFHFHQRPDAPRSRPQAPSRPQRSPALSLLESPVVSFLHGLYIMSQPRAQTRRASQHLA
jgi:hypothetical protein